MSWHHILFVVDSAGHVGPRMLRKLAHLARSLDAEVELIQSAFEWRALNKGGIGSGASDCETRETIVARSSELKHIVEALQASGVRARATVTCERPGYLSISHQMLLSKPDLLVIQSTHHSALARVMLSYTDFKLIETCPCPLLILKNEKAYLEGCVVAAVDPMHSHDKPAALDEMIVDTAARLATAVQGTLHLYHVSVPWTNLYELDGASAQMPAPVFAELSAAYESESELRMQALRHRAKLGRERVHVEHGDPADMLPRFARSLNAAVMVMGAVSRSALRRALIGHTAERVLDALDCDVLVVKAPGFISPLVDEHPATVEPPNVCEVSDLGRSAESGSCSPQSSADRHD